MRSYFTRHLFVTLPSIVALGAFGLSSATYANQELAADQQELNQLARPGDRHGGGGRDGSRPVPRPGRPEPRPAPRPDRPRPEPRPAPRPDPRPAPRPDPRPRPVPRPEPRPVPRPVPRPEPRPVPRPEPRPVPRPVPRPEPRPVPRPVPNPRPYPRPIPQPRPIPRPRPYPQPRPRPVPIPQPPRPVPPRNALLIEGELAPQNAQYMDSYVAYTVVLEDYHTSNYPEVTMTLYPRVVCNNVYRCSGEQRLQASVLEVRAGYADACYATVYEAYDTFGYRDPVSYAELHDNAQSNCGYDNGLTMDIEHADGTREQLVGYRTY